MKKMQEKKNWIKPVFNTISSEELKNYIKAAARSAECLGSFGR